MPRRSTSSLFLVIVLACRAVALCVGGVLVIDAAAREPQKSPPASPPVGRTRPVARSTIEDEVVRARDLGVPFEGTPAKFNAITDVAGVEVGYTTLISGDGKLVVRQGQVTVGVTAVLQSAHADKS